MKEQIKDLRIKIDALAQLTKELKPVSTSKWVNPNEYYIFMDNSQEINKATDSLYLAKAWLGKVLGELGNENPYGSGYKTKEDIVFTQDVHQDIDRFTIREMAGEDIIWKKASHIEKVDWLRTEIGKFSEEIINLKDITHTINCLIATTNCYTHLCEARFWLGFELERIKNN